MNLASIALATVLSLPSGLTLHEFAGFETGGEEEFGSASEYNVTASGITAHNDKELYVCTLGYFIEGSPSSYVQTHEFSGLASGDWVSVGGWVYFDGGIDVDADMDFLYVGQVGGWDIALNIYSSDGDLRVKDKDDSVVATVSDAFVEDTWYLVELKYEVIHMGAEAQVWINEESVVELTSENFLGSAANLARRARFRGPATGPANSAHVALTVDSYYVYYDDGAAIDTYDTIHGEFSVIGPYNDTNSTNSDFGDDPDLGSWSNTTDVPSNDATAMRFDGGGSDNGGCTANDGDNSGPFGDSDSLGTIKGASWIADVRQRKAIGESDQQWRLKYGAHTVATTDNTSSTGAMSLSSGCSDFQLFLDDSSADCPTKQEYFQFGAIKETDSASYADMIVCDMWCFILLQDRRTVNLNGSVQERER